MRVVQFIDWDGTVIDIQSILHGFPATAPPDPSRGGYTFDRWNPSDFSIVVSDMTITATYIADECEHVWDSGTVTLEPTCTEDGVRTFTCTRCDETRPEPIPALSHAWDDGTVTLKPTVDKEGEKTFTCGRCGEERVEMIPALHVVTVGAQVGTLRARAAGTVKFPVTTANIADGAYAATVANLPTGVTVQGQVAITNNAGTLTLAASSSTIAGTTDSLALTISGATSPAFTLTIEAATVTNTGGGGGIMPSQPQPTPTPTPATTVITPIDVPGISFNGSYNDSFEDVATGVWYYSDVKYVARNGLMNGTSTSPMLFSPSLSTTRGMIVTILYRLSGSPDASALPSPFDDVAAGAWYFDAVKWAAENGIVSGYGGGKFGPVDDITREQLATILNNYAIFAGLNLPTKKEYQAFADDANIAGYAKGAVERLFKAGVVGGKQDNSFDPKGNATRAEVASMLTRFISAKEA